MAMHDELYDIILLHYWTGVQMKLKQYIKAMRSVKQWNVHLIFQTVQQSRLPFEITLVSLREVPTLEEGLNFSYAGIKMIFKRNNVGLLASGFYFPTLVFSLLSLLSFAIKPEVVSYCIISFIHSNGILILYIFPIIV